MDFLDQGGEIDPWMSDGDEGDKGEDGAEPQRVKLRAEAWAAWEEVRRLEDKLRSSPHIPDDPDETTEKGAEPGQPAEQDEKPE